eukprot:347701-Chlamydomonas_euryale.AAC.13
MASRITSRSVQPHGRHTCSSVSYCGRPFGSLLMRQPVPCRRLLAASCLHDGRQDAAGRAAGDDELPEALKDLQLTDDGILIDEKTGKQINEFGATRWDVAVRAMRGELDPPAWEGMYRVQLRGTQAPLHSRLVAMLHCLTSSLPA